MSCHSDSSSRTGTRWVTLIQLPVAFCVGSSENSARVPGGAIVSTSAVKLRTGKASNAAVAGWPGAMRANWVSLKFPLIQV